MEDENLNVAEPTANENVGTQPTEQNEEKNAEFTAEQQEKINEIVKARVASTKRAEERKYSKLINSLRAGLGTDNIDEMTDIVTKNYEEQGVKIPQMPTYSEEDEETLANAEAQKIIDLGYDAIVSETENMKDVELTGRDKRVYKALEKKRQDIERLKELEKIGVSKEEISSTDFKEFAKKFNSQIPYTEIYDLYEKTKPKQEPSSIGSMTSTSSEEEIKEYYSPDDFDKLTPEQLDNPKIWERVMESKKKWTK